MLDYVILIYATILGIILKGPVSICSQKSSFLVGKAYNQKIFDVFKGYMERENQLENILMT